MKQPGDFSGVIGELVAGRWHDPHTGVKQTIPVESIVIADTLDGSEAELVHRVHPGKSLCVVSDQWTRAALGERVFRALQPLGNVKEFVWKRRMRLTNTPTIAWRNLLKWADDGIRRS
jgi:hypothetical protein